ncbi:EF-hand domain-containing protein [Uliginosibacterium sp. H3]|uniref:EF-hand domain-containing protein n=1 Tax=Uliginosibacterium silvisoli TaxID=3114758 RepID=A0ABU6K1H3_9RHOO|nr:EF-hand domain-containing protein [Uliginosibacterium sp. H3]
MSSISSTGNSVSSSFATMMPRRQRPDASKIAEDIFSKLDTKGQGYIEKSDLQNALSSLSGTDSANSSSSSSSVDDLFSQLDGDSDGKVTKKELADSMQSLADALDSQAMSSRMQMGGMPPPPPPGGQGGPGGPGDDAGFTKDELTSMASDVASTDSKRASFMNDVASNFDKADTDGDGKVSFKEAMAYEQSSETSASASASSNSSTSSTNSSATQESQARMMQQLMQLIHAYGDASKSNPSASISAVA